MTELVLKLLEIQKSLDRVIDTIGKDIRWKKISKDKACGYIEGLTIAKNIVAMHIPKLLEED